MCGDDGELLGLVLLALWLFGWYCGHKSHQQSVQSEIARHTGPSMRRLTDLPAQELLGILNFAVTGRKPSGW